MRAGNRLSYTALQTGAASPRLSTNGKRRHQGYPMKRIVQAGFVMLAGAVAGCGDAARITSPATEVPASLPVVGSMRATVDLVAGTLTFEPVASTGRLTARRSSVSAAIYGNQGVTVRIYNSAVVISDSPTPGKKRFTANVGVRNLQDFPIGDEQGGAAPLDTSGIFVFVNGGPAVTRTSSDCIPACSITVANAHGRAAFNAPSQSYWFWHDRLSAAGAGRDTTLERQSWSFEADTQVTGFTFDVLVGAAWPAPHETRWKTEFSGDALPQAGTPRWSRSVSLGTESAMSDPLGSGHLLLTALANGSQTFERRDSVGPTSDVYIEARVRLNTAPSKAEVSFGFYDGSRYIAVGLSGTRAGFMDNGFTSGGVSVISATTTFQTYRLRKFSTDSVQLLVNGTRVLSRPYSAFGTSYGAIPSFFEFGNPGTNNQQRSQAGNSSTWDYVVYEIGATQP